MRKKLKIITFDDLQEVENWHPRKQIVFVSGTYDLLHPGHVHFFELAKQSVHAGILVVGVGCDADIKRYKGDTRPIMGENARLKLVAALEVVDYAFITHAPPEGKGHFLDGFAEIFRALQPNAYVVNEDTFDMEHRQNLAEGHLVKMFILDHSTTCRECKGISASSIIQRVLEAESAKT